MAQDNFTACMTEIFAHEGGLSMIRSDPGNWTGGKVGVGVLRGTNFGIAAHANPGVDIKNLTKARASDIYRRQYWSKVNGDDLPPGLDLVTFDPAVNSGVKRGVQWLQRAVGASPDGVMGQKTMAFVRDARDVPAIRQACAARMGFLRGLRTWSTFGRGWSTRVARVEAVALRMAFEANGETARLVLLAEKENAITRAKREGQAASGTAAAGGGGFTFADIPEWALTAGGILLALAIINMIGRRRHELARAAAMQLVAEEAKA